MGTCHTTIDVISDLHIDHYKNPALLFSELIAQSGVGTDLLIAGDISNSLIDTLEFLEQIRDMPNSRGVPYMSIMFVDGNHEHYLSDTKAYPEKYKKYFSGDLYKDIDWDNPSVETNRKLLKRKSSGIQKVVYLDNTYGFRVCDGGKTVSVIGTNGWSSYDYRFPGEDEASVQERLRTLHKKHNDFRHVPEIEKIPLLAAKEAKQFITYAEEVSRAVDTLILVTHTAPHMRLVTSGSPDVIDCCYFNQHMATMFSESHVLKNVKYWVYGHTHRNRGFVCCPGFGSTIFLNNAFGYKHESQHVKLVNIQP